MNSSSLEPGYVFFVTLFVLGCRQDVSAPPQRIGSQPTFSAEESASRDELISAVSSKNFDQTILVMNKIKRVRYQGEILPLVRALWLFDLSSMPTVDKDFASHPRVRLEVADVLIQASRNGERGLDPAAYRQYARQHVVSDDRDIARQAILVLGVANEPDDIELLRSVFVKENDATFRSASLALAQNCALSETRMIEIAADLRSRTLEALFRSSWKEAQALRQVTCR